MTGLPRWGFDVFEAECSRLRAAGFEVVSPHEFDLEVGFDPDDPDDSTFDLEAALHRDLEAVASVDLVALLPGWEGSPGTLLEVVYAEALGVPWVPADALA